jgi:hypothetical protein
MTEGSMAVRQFDAVAEIQNAFQILTKNWQLAIPTAVSSLIATIYVFTVLGAALAAVGLGAMGGRAGILGGLGAFSGITVIGIILVALVSIIASAMVMASSQDAWSGRPLDMSRSFGRALACLVNIIIAGIVICLMLLVATIIPVLGWLVVGFLVMYTLPAIVVGNAGAIDAIGQSFKLTTGNFGPSIVAFLGVVLALVVGGIVNNIFVHVFGLNFIISIIVGGFTSAFAALVSVRFYDLLRAPALTG